jgi:hypothetical protein
MNPSTNDAWFYVNRGTVDVYARTTDENTTVVRLTRKQLERALEIMGGA